MRRERMDFERSLAILKHDAKEAQRKFDFEAESRLNAEKKLRAAEEHLQAEVSARMQMSSSSQHHNERVAQLERKIADLNDKVLSEQETCSKYRKSYQDMQQVRNT